MVSKWVKGPSLCTLTFYIKVDVSILEKTISIAKSEMTSLVYGKKIHVENLYHPNSDLFKVLIWMPHMYEQQNPNRESR